MCMYFTHFNINIHIVCAGKFKSYICSFQKKKIIM